MTDRILSHPNKSGAMSNGVSEVTRRSIIDFFAVSRLRWAGRLDEDDFLARLYDLAKMPLEDYRFQNAAGDIHQHRINNFDWDDDWIFYDSRFNLLHAPDDQFLRFLCETLHPVVRPSAEETNNLADEYNKVLAADGWKIIEVKQISGRPVFSAQKSEGRVEIFKEPTAGKRLIVKFKK